MMLGEDRNAHPKHHAGARPDSKSRDAIRFRQIQKYDWARPVLGRCLEIRLFLGVALGIRRRV